MEKLIQITSEPIDIEQLEKRLESACCGATVQFLGKVRNQNERKKVIYIEYSAYLSLAQSEIEKVVLEAHERWKFSRCGVVHRIGRLNVGEIAIAIIVSSPHRQETFLSCQYIIDEIKKRVPIWKKEYYETGYQWIGCYGGSTRRTADPQKKKVSLKRQT